MFIVLSNTECGTDTPFIFVFMCNTTFVYLGFSGMNGQEWLEQRRFCMYTMRNLGMGKGLWETMIQVGI